MGDPVGQLVDELVYLAREVAQFVVVVDTRFVAGYRVGLVPDPM